MIYPHFKKINTLLSVLSLLILVACSDEKTEVINQPIPVSDINFAPVANAGSDQLIYERKPIFLDAISSYDLNDEIVSYSWRQLESSAGDVTIVSPNSATTELVLPEVSFTTEFLFAVQVKDSFGVIATDVVKVTISYDSNNRPPYANAGHDMYVKEMDSVFLNASLSYDTDDEIVSYSWTQLSTDAPTVEIVSPDSAVTELKLPAVADYSIEFTFILKVEDTHGYVSVDVVKVVLQNATPIAEVKTNSYYVEELTSIDMSAEDSVNLREGSLSYRWKQIANGSPDVVIHNSNAMVATIDLPAIEASSQFRFELTVTDEIGEINSRMFTIRASDISPNATFSGAYTGNEGSTFEFNASYSSDPREGGLQYLWEQVPNGAPAITIESADSKLTNITLPNVSEDSIVQLKLTVTDISGSQGSYLRDITVKDVADWVVQTGTIKALYPLSEGLLYLGNQTTNKIEYRNIFTAEVLLEYQLNGSPVDIEFVEGSKKLYVTQKVATSLAIIDTLSGEISYIELGAKIFEVTEGVNDAVYIISQGDNSNNHVYRINSDHSIDGPWDVSGTMIEYNAVASEIIVASSYTLSRYKFDENKELMLTQSVRKGGQDLAISADGTSLAIANGGGNGNGYTLVDFNLKDLNILSGEWNTSYYPRSVDFSNDSRLLAASNGSKLFVFDKTTHVELFSHNLLSCSYGGGEVGTKFSADAKTVYQMMNCSNDEDNGTLVAFDISALSIIP